MAIETLTREEQIEKEMTAKYGRRLLPNQPFRTTAPLLEGHKPEEEAKLIKIYERGDNWVLTGKDGKPDEEAKEFLYRIVAIITACLGADETETRINFQVQKYWRNKTYEAQKSPNDAGMERRNHPFFEVFPQGDRLKRDGQLKRTGEAIYDGDDFLKKFQIDKSE